MNEQHTKAIEEFVSAYCAKHGLIPNNHQLHIKFSFVEVKPVVAESTNTISDNSDPKEDLLNMSAISSFNEFSTMDADRPLYISERVENAIYSFTRKNEPTIRDVICGEHVVSSKDANWLRLRNFGKKSLKYLDQWLASLNLERLPYRPH